MTKYECVHKKRSFLSKCNIVLVQYHHLISLILKFIVHTVTCQALTKVDNGDVKCSLGDDGIYSFEDTCTFTCNSGYTLTGSGTRTCQSDGSWSGSDGACNRGTKIKYV